MLIETEADILRRLDSYDWKLTRGGQPLEASFDFIAINGQWSAWISGDGKDGWIPLQRPKDPNPLPGLAKTVLEKACEITGADHGYAIADQWVTIAEI